MHLTDDAKNVRHSPCVKPPSGYAFLLTLTEGLAEAAVRYPIGVTGIINDVTIESSVKMVDVKQKIEDAFQRQARLDAKDAPRTDAARL